MISPLAHVDPKAVIAPDATIMPFAYIEGNVTIGSQTVIMPYASVMDGTTIGERCRVFQGAILGAEPQDFRWKGQPTGCVIGNDNVIREHVIINRGIHPDTPGTTVGDHCHIMAEAHIGHDTHIHGRDIIGNGVTIAGDVDVAECVILSSNAVVHEGCKIGRWAMVKGGCRIGSNVPPYVIVAHNPVQYYGINATVMRKGEFTEDDIDNAAKAYRHVYQCSTSVFNALLRIKADLPDDAIRREILGFIEDSHHRIVGVSLDLYD